MPAGSSGDCPHLECVGEITKEELIQKSHVSVPSVLSSHNLHHLFVFEIQAYCLGSSSDCVAEAVSPVWFREVEPIYGDVTVCCVCVC